MCFLFFLPKVDVHRCTSAYLYRRQKEMGENDNRGIMDAKEWAVQADRKKDGVATLWKGYLLLSLLTKLLSNHKDFRLTRTSENCTATSLPPLRWHDWQETIQTKHAAAARIATPQLGWLFLQVRFKVFFWICKSVIVKL